MYVILTAAEIFRLAMPDGRVPNDGYLLLNSFSAILSACEKQ